MGYYSLVALALDKTGVDALNAKLKSAPEKERKEVMSLLAHAEKHYTDSKTGAEAWKWDWMKWYAYDPEDFPAVNFIETLMKEIKGSHYDFIRVGEDWEDAEQKGFIGDNPFSLCLNRQIEIEHFS